MPVPKNEPSIYHDRVVVSELKQADSALLGVLLERGIGKVDRKEHLHFCGMVYRPSEGTTVFLPRALEKNGCSTAALTMATLARFGKESSNREFDADGEVGNSGLLSIIVKLAEDFRNNGVFSERQRIRSRNVGKPDWPRTIKRERAFPTHDGRQIFTDLITTKSIDSSETLLAQIQGMVVSEIIDMHHWWINGLRSRQSELRHLPKPTQPRRLWPHLLDAILPRLFSTRAIFLARSLIYYLRENRASSNGNLVFGIEDFHSVWECMLRRTLENVDPNWNSRLPRAVYHSTSNGKDEDATERGMLTDIIQKTTEGYVIVDAKYYAANSAVTLPGWPDIAKQMFYELALQSVVGSIPRIRNCFVFPANTEQLRPFSKLDMRSRLGGHALHDFPSIDLIYLSIFDVMAAYIEGRKLRLPY